jgi:acetyl esterase/lipase
MDEYAIDSKTEAGSADNKCSKTPIEKFATYSRLSSSDRFFLQHLEQLPQLGALSVEEERVRMRAGQVGTAGYPVTFEHHQTTACLVHLIRPIEVSTPAPVMFFLHGGGWMLGDLDTHMKLVCALAVHAQCVVAFIDYPRAPEHMFPDPLEASITAFYEVLESSEALGLDKNKFAIGGDSAGGNLAAALILSAIERKFSIPMQQILLYPVTDHDTTTPSYHEFRDNPNLSQATMKWFWNHYLPEKPPSNDPRISPLYAADEILAQFPPTLLVTCEYDVLRDEGESFAARLIRAGVDVTAVRWLGSLHGFMVNDALSSSTSAQSCIAMVGQYIKHGFKD